MSNMVFFLRFADQNGELVRSIEHLEPGVGVDLTLEREEVEDVSKLDEVIASVESQEHFFKWVPSIERQRAKLLNQ